MGSLGVRDEGRCVKIKRRCAARELPVRRGCAGRAAPLRRCPTPAASAAPSCSERTENQKRSVPSHCYLIALSSNELFIHSMTCCFLYDRPTISWFLVSYRQKIACVTIRYIVFCMYDIWQKIYFTVLWIISKFDKTLNLIRHLLKILQSSYQDEMFQYRTVALIFQGRARLCSK